MLASCAKKTQESARDIGPVADAYFKAHPDFFRYKTPADLPKTLEWQDGHDVPEFADPSAKRGGTLHAAQPDFPRTLRYYGVDANGGLRAFILDDNAISLVQRQPNTDQYFPGLARQWAVDPDGRTIYFRLDPAATYSDGVPVRADDFFFAFYFFRSSFLNDPFSQNYYGSPTYFGPITKYDQLTFSLSWSEPKPDLMDRLGGLLPVPEHFYKDLGPDYAERYQWTIEPTTGPYTVRPEDIHKGSYVDLTRVPHWWADQKPFFRHRFNPDRIRFTAVRDRNKMYEMFKRGEIDVLAATRTQVWNEIIPNSDPLVQHGAVAKVTFYNNVPRPTYGFSINTSEPLLSNRDIREGIAYASNFDLVDKDYYRGEYKRMQTSADGYAQVPFPGIHPRPFSVENALACFAKAGFVHRGSDGVLTDDQGHRLSFTITTPDEPFRDPLTILRQEALKAGLEFKIEILDETTAFKKISEKHAQIAFLGMNTGITMYPDYWQAFDSSNANKPNTNNFTDTVDQVMDKLIAQYDKARTMDEIRPLARELELRIREDAAFIPGFEFDYFREAYWRWIKFPKAFSTRESIGDIGWNGLDYGLFWIDDSVRPEVNAAATGGAPLPPEIKAYDKWESKGTE